MKWDSMKWFVVGTVLLIAAVLLIIPRPDDHWSMVYEAIQVPEQPGGQKRFVLFNEDGLTEQACTDLYDEHLRRLNNNAAVIEYEISCSYIQTKGHGMEFQYQNQWLIP